MVLILTYSIHLNLLPVCECTSNTNVIATSSPFKKIAAWWLERLHCLIHRYLLLLIWLLHSYRVYLGCLRREHCVELRASIRGSCYPRLMALPLCLLIWLHLLWMKDTWMDPTSFLSILISLVVNWCFLSVLWWASSRLIRWKEGKICTIACSIRNMSLFCSPVIILTMGEWVTWSH